jgi:hypothetical protein
VIRLYLALIGALFVVAGVAGHAAGVLAAGLIGLAPLLVTVVRLPKAGRAGFVLTAVVAGLLLAGFTVGHHDAGHHGGPSDQPRPVPAACVAEAGR